jgi:predicted hydrocarbon binding protein
MLDQQIMGGGIPEGSLVCFLANPESMAEVFLYQFSSGRKTYYLSTVRRPEWVEKNMKDLNFPVENIEFINLYSRFNLKEEETEISLPTARKNLYSISHHNATRSAKIFIKTAKMPKDMFWKFNFWSREKAITIVGEIADKIFSEMLRASETATLDMIEAEPRNFKFSVRFKECNECQGLSGLKSGACSYHAGVFAGILSSLLDQELDAYETSCRAVGDQECTFSIGPRQSKEVRDALTRYLNPPVGATAAQATFFIESTLEKIESSSNVVIDTFSFLLDLAESKERIRQMLNLIYELTVKKNCVTLLYLLKDAHPKEVEKMIINQSDVVFDFDTKISGNEIQTTISIPKTRGIVSPARRIRLAIGERIQIDTAREIA